MNNTRRTSILIGLMIALACSGCDGESANEMSLSGEMNANERGDMALGASTAPQESSVGYAPSASDWDGDEYNASMPEGSEGGYGGEEGGAGEGDYAGEEGGSSESGEPVEPVEQEGNEYEDPGTNPFVLTEAQPTSTFASDSDTASYDLFLQAIQYNDLPHPSSVRLEEFVNFFKYDYVAPNADHEEPFRVQVDVTESPFTPGAQIMRIGIQGKKAADLPVKGINVVFLVDVSGSMAGAAKLPLVKALLSEAVLQLEPTDTISIVTYAGYESLHLPATSASNQDTIISSIESLASGGGTNGAGGIDMAYTQAESAFIEGGINHVVLCTDGDFNVGPYSTADLLELIAEKRKTGVTLTVLGFGYGNLNDAMMELVSNAGNGVYGIISNLDDAIQYAATKLLSTLNMIAKDVKIQVEINSDVVYAYRQLGYENRQLEDWMFFEDTVDAGELPAEHAVTALYELIPVGQSLPEPEGAPELLTTAVDPFDMEIAEDEMVLVKIRYKDIEDSEEDPSFQINTARLSGVEAMAFEDADPSFQFAVAVAAFAEILKESPFARKDMFGTIQNIVAATKENIPARNQFAEAIEFTAEKL